MEQKSNGALIGSIIVIIILAVGGIYLYQMYSKQYVGQPAPASTNTTVQLNTSTSSNPSDIENDLNKTNVDNLDSTL